MVLDGYQLLGNAIIKQATDDYIILSRYIHYNPLTPDVKMRANSEEKERKKKLQDYIDTGYALYKERMEKNFEDRLKKGFKSLKDENIARITMHEKIFLYKQRLKEHHPSSYDKLGKWEEYRNCILGARASKEQLRKDLMGPYLGLYLGKIDPEYLLNELDKKVHYMAAHGCWDVKVTDADRRDLNINVRKPRGC